MTEIVVTVKRAEWVNWLKLPTHSGALRSFHIFGERPPASAGDLLYVLAHGRIRCMLEIERVTPLRRGWFIQCTMIGPVTVTGTAKGFPGWLRTWWQRREEMPFPDWQTAGVFYPAAEASA